MLKVHPIRPDTRTVCGASSKMGTRATTTTGMAADGWAIRQAGRMAGKMADEMTAKTAAGRTADWQDQARRINK
jgi:hypothetical protein